MPITEHNVAEHIRKRNEKAITFIIQTYGGLLAAIIKRHVHNDQQEYEECLDDVLLAIWQHIDSFDESRSSFKQWTAAIAKYRAIDYERAIIRNRHKYKSAQITDELYEPQRASLQEELEEALAGLPAAERAIFEQYYLEGVSTSELAGRMQVKTSWIHNKLSRGRKKLKQMMLSRNEV